jgi:integrase
LFRIYVNSAAVMGIAYQSNKRLKISRVTTPRQFQGLLGELKDPDLTMVFVAGGPGLRVSEILGLNCGDVKWQDLEVDVRGTVVAGRENAIKTEALEKPVLFDPPIATALLKWRGQTHYLADSNFVFAGDSGRPRWQAMVVKDYIQSPAERAKVGKVGWHTSRHSYRAWLKRCGTPLEVQKDLMRHANVKVTAEV